MQCRHHRQRQELAKQADDDKGQCGTGGKPDDRAQACQQHHLCEIDRKDVAAGKKEDASLAANRAASLADASLGETQKRKDGAMAAQAADAQAQVAASQQQAAAAQNDAAADRKSGVLTVNAVHQDIPFTREMAEAIDAEIADLAAWLGLEQRRTG